MIHHDDGPDVQRDLVQRVRASLDAHGLPVPGYDVLGDLDHGALLASLATLGWSAACERRTVDGAWRVCLATAHGEPVEAEAYSREDAWCKAALVALEGVAV